MFKVYCIYADMKLLVYSHNKRLNKRLHMHDSIFNSSTASETLG